MLPAGRAKGKNMDEITKRLEQLQYEVRGDQLDLVTIRYRLSRLVDIVLDITAQIETGNYAGEK